MTTTKKRRRRRKHSAEVNLGFQIAPMIDVVFVILLFFIVQASDIQVENAHVTKLPGTVVLNDNEAIPPEEVAIRIEDDGQVYLNDDPLDATEGSALPELTGTLADIKKTSDAANSKILVTIYANELAKYQRVVDVLDALSQVKISDVSFQAGAPE